MRIQPTPLTTQPKREQHPHVDAMGSTWIGEIGIVGTAAAMSEHGAITPRKRESATCRSRWTRCPG